MIIKSIEIKDFQSYYQENELEFGKGLNLIIANGGKGKSKLFNAFYWVLFGRIYITDYGWASTNGLPSSANYKMQRHDFVNKKSLYEANVGDTIDCYVRLELEDDKGIEYQIVRSVTVTRKESENWESVTAWDVPASTLKVIYDEARGTVTKVDSLAELKIATLFPEGIRGYIWFQGESLDELINFQKPQTLKDAVKHISYFPYYEKLTAIINQSQEKIEKLESRHLKEANKQNNQIKALLSNIDYLNLKEAKEKENNSKLKRQIETIQIALQDDEGKISGIASFSNLVQKYEECEKEIIKINDELTKIDEKQRELLPTLWVLRGISPMVEKCKEIIASHVEEVYTMPEKKYLDNPSREKLEEILNHSHQCFVCGSKVDEDHPDTVAWIKRRLELQDEFLREMEDYTTNMEASKRFNMFIGKIQDYPSSLMVSLGEIDKQYLDSEAKIEELFAKRRKITERKKKFDEEIEEVKRKYGVDPHREASNVTTLNSSIKASRSNLEKLQRLLKASDTELDDIKKELRKANTELNSTTNGSKAKDLVKVPETEWKLITAHLQTICKSVQERARKELLSKIQDRANEFYVKFTEHDKGYKGKVEIGSDYSIKFDSLLNTSHEDRKKMSVINALLSLNQEAMNTYYPFISDAPTSSFDIDTTHKYLLGIKDMFGQSIIMTKDVEINSPKYNELLVETNVSHIYNLTSKVYRTDNEEPEIYEVSTNINRLK